MNRPSVAFVAWTSAPVRANEMAMALGGVAFCPFPLGRLRAATPIRYLMSVFLTCAFLLRVRPRAVIVTNPPIFPAVIALAYARLSGSPLLLDSHPGGFGLQGDRLSARLQPLVREVVKRADATLVTDRSLSAVVERWGGRAQIIHEAPPAWAVPTVAPPNHPPLVLFVGTFGRDEPVDAVLHAARALPDVRFRITGDLRRADPSLQRACPPNVDFVGFLRSPDFALGLGEADLVLTLTTEPTSVVKAGSEAVYAGRPLIVSDSPAAREAFPFAVFTKNSWPALAKTVRAALDQREELLDRVGPARSEQSRRWAEQLRDLERLIGE